MSKSWKSFLFVVILVVCLVLTYFIRLPQHITILWTIILVVITSFYAYSTFQILEIQKKSEILKYFLQVNLKSVKIDQISRYVDKIELEFLNFSNGMGHNAKFRIYNGDSIIEMKDKDKIYIDKDIGILVPNLSNRQKIFFKDPIEVSDKTKLRLELKFINLARNSRA